MVSRMAEESIKKREYPMDDATKSILTIGSIIAKLYIIIFMAYGIPYWLSDLDKLPSQIGVGSIILVIGSFTLALFKWFNVETVWKDELKSRKKRGGEQG